MNLNEVASKAAEIIEDGKKEKEFEEKLAENLASKLVADEVVKFEILTHEQAMALLGAEEVPLMEFKYDPNIALRNISEEVLSAIEIASKDLPDLSTAKGMKEVRARRTSVVKTRTGADKYRKELKAPALDWCKTVEEEFGNDIEPRLKAVEKTYNDAIKAEEKRKKDEKQAEAKKENARIAAIDEKIQKIKGFSAGCIGKSSSEIKKDLTTIQNFVCDKAVFEERFEEAVLQHNVTVEQVQALYGTEKAREDQAAELEAKNKQVDEERRVAKIRSCIDSISHVLVKATTLDSDGTLEAMKSLDKFDPTKFGDLKREGEERIAEVKAGLKALYAGKILTEKAAAQEVQEALDKPVHVASDRAVESVDISPGSTQGHGSVEIVQPSEKPFCKVEEDGTVTDEPVHLGVDHGVEPPVNPVAQAAAQVTEEKPEPKTATHLMVNETYKALIELTDENIAEILMEALIAGSIPHIYGDWNTSGK